MFGYAAAAGDFNGDGYRDLAVGVLEHRGGGAVNVIYGSRDGLKPAGSEQWTQDSPGIPGVSDPGDTFGHALAAGDFDADGYADLAVGNPREYRRDPPKASREEPSPSSTVHRQGCVVRVASF
jgi:hypothetical protein